jgi:hypothetical protein
LIDERAVRKQLSDKRKAGAKPAFPMASDAAPPKPKALDLKKPSDLVEAELLEILLTQPTLVETLRLRISAEQLANPVLKSLLYLAYDLFEAGELPTFDRMMGDLEDPQHKQALMRIDDLAKEKKIAQKLLADKTADEPEGLIPYLEEVVRRLLLQNERQKFESLKGALVQSPSKPSATDGPAGELQKEHLRYLLEAQKFHAKRANS